MKVTVNQNHEIELEEVFNPIALRTRDGETMVITMRDSGFEFTYQGKKYTAKNGKVSGVEPFSFFIKGEDLLLPMQRKNRNP